MPPIPRRPRFAPSFPRVRLRFIAGALLAGFLGLLVAAGGFALWRVATHNEDVVTPGILYRSSQLTGPELQDEIARHHIRSVINLRGTNTGTPWYEDEVAVCRKLQVRHFDVRLSAMHLPPPAELDQLLSDFQAAPRPILIHCLSGSDRTGLAACIYLIDQENVPWRQAEGALSWRYGHFPIYPYFEMDETVQLFGQNPHASLRNWVRDDYPAIYNREMTESRRNDMEEPVELLVRGRLN